MNYKKPKLWMTSVTIIVLITIGIMLLSNSKQKSIFNNTNAVKDKIDNMNKVEETETEKESNIKLGDISKIEVYHSFFNNFDKNYKPIVLDDKLLVQQVCEMLEESSLTPQNDKINNMSGMKSYLNKLVLFKADGTNETIPFTYDDLYKVGFIEYHKEKLYPSYDFFRYIGQIDEFRNISSDVNSVNKLFLKYGYTPCFKINTVERTLPENLKHKAGEYPEKLYWAFNNELSKEIGLDMIPYLGKKVTCEIYYLKEPLPEFMKPMLTARGIVIKYQGEIIGAYLDSGRHSGFAAALDGKAFKDITNKEWDEWITYYIDYNDSLEKTISSMTPEELINTYYKAQDRDDDKMTFACMSRKNIVNWLFMNMDNNKLFNYSLNDARSGNRSYIDTVKVIEIKELKDNASIKEYRVILDLKVRDFATCSSGKQPRILQLVKEGNGWRIEGEGN